MSRFFFPLLIFLLLVSADAFAGKRYWIATTTQNWNNTANWSSVSATGAGGALVPGSGDTAYFTGNRNGSCTINAAVSVMRMEVISAYSGTISQGANTITIGTGNAVFGSGTFTGGSAAITCNGSFTISGTAFTSTSNTFTCVGNFSLNSGSFTHNSGTVLFTTSNTIAGTIGFNHLTFTPAATAVHSISNTITANGTLTLSGSNQLKLDNGTIDTKSNITSSNSGTGGGGSATITVTGSATVTLTGNSTVGNGALPKVTINKSGGQLNLASTISVANDWTWTAGTISYGSSVVAFVNTLTITGSHNLNSVTFKSSSPATYTIANGTTLSVNGTLTTDGTGAQTFNTGTINMKGANTVLSNSGTGGGGTALFLFTHYLATITGNSTIGNGTLPKVTLDPDDDPDGGGGVVTLASTISVMNDYTFSGGSISVGSSTVAFLGSLTISGGPEFNNITFQSNSGTTYTISSGTPVILGTFATAGSGSLTFNGGTIDTRSTINLNNSGTGGGGSATITLTGNSSLTMTGNSTVGQSALPKVTINKGGGTLTLASTISVANDWTWTAGTLSTSGSTVAFLNSCTISGSHTLNNVTFQSNSASTFVISNTLGVNGTLTTAGSGTLKFNTGTIDAKNAVTLNNTGTDGGGSALVSFTGSGTASITGGSTVGHSALPRVTINKTGGIGPAVSLSGIISVANDYTYTAGTVTYNSSTVAFVDTLTITGSHGLNHVTFKSNADAIYTIGGSTTLTVNGTLTTDGSGKLTFNSPGSGTIDTKSTINLNNSGTGGGGTAIITLTGTASLTMTGNSTIGQSALPKVTINKGGGTLTLASTISAANNWTWTAGTLSTTGSTVAFLNTLTVAGSHGLNNVTFQSNSATNFTVSNTLTVNGTLTIGGSGALSFLTGTIDAKGNVNLNNMGTGGGGNATIRLSGSSNVSMTGNSTIGYCALPIVDISRSTGGTLTLVNTISVVAGWTRTSGDVSPGSSTVAFIGAAVITGTDTLNHVTFHSDVNVSYSFGTGSVLRVDSTLRFTGSGRLSFFALSGTTNINVLGNIIINNTGVGGSSGSSVVITAIGNRTVNFDSNVASLQGCLPSVAVNKTGGSITLMDTITVRGDWIVTTPAYLNAGTSTLFLSSSSTTTLTGIHTLNNVYLSGGTYTITSGDTMKVTGILKYTGSTALTINTGVIAARGNVVLQNSASGGGGTGLLLIDGTATQEVLGYSLVPSTSSRLPSVRIKKTGGSVTLKNFILVSGDWIYTSGTLIAHSTSTVGFGVTKTISGTHTLNKVQFAGSTATFTIATGTVLTVSDTLQIGGSGVLTITGDTINAQKHVISTNTGAGTGGDAKIKFSGSNNQDLVGSGVAGSGGFPLIVINKSGGTLTLKSTITAACSWVYIAGTVDASTNSSTVTFMGNFSVDGQGTSSTMSFWNVSTYSGTRTLTGNMDVDNNVSIGSGSTLAASSYTCFVGGNWTNSGTFTAGTSTVTFNGVKYNTISKPSSTETFYNLTFNRAYDGGVKKSVTLGSQVDVTNVLTLTQGRIKTTTTNYLRLMDNATCSGGGDSAYVDGPMRKLGNDAFAFPLGDTVFADTASYHPLSITAPSSGTDEFEAEYYGVGQTAGDSLVDSLVTISDQEYWRLDRKAGSATVYTTLGWNKNSTYVQDYNTLRVANWNNVKWLDLGGTGVTITGRRGTVTAVVAPSYVASSALLSLSNQVNAETYAVLHRELDGGYYLVNNGALYFMYDEEYNDTDDELSFTIYDQQRRIVAQNTGTYAIVRTSDYGDNRFYINLLSCSTNAGGYVGSGVYILEVSNEKGEKWFLRFKHVTTIVPLCPGSQPQ